MLAMMEDRIRRLVYVSDAARPMSEDDLAALLADARERNRGLGVTGMLLYKGGNFIQTVEGPTGGIDALMRAIRADGRHRNLFVMLDETARVREFPDWAMGYRRLAPDGETSLQLDELTLQSQRLAARIAEDTLAQRFMRVFHDCLR
jgi:hypothetical protein